MDVICSLLAVFLYLAAFCLAIASFFVSGLTVTLISVIFALMATFFLFLSHLS